MEDKKTIFEYATSELSQDAVILWLLNDEGTREETVRFLLKNSLDKQYQVEDFTIKKIEKPKKQENYIDVFVEFTDTNGKRHALIIEDKTDTEMHDQQMIQYIHQVALQYKPDFIHFVLFKTGVISFVEIDHYNAEIKAITDAEFFGEDKEENVNREYDLNFVVRPTKKNIKEVREALRFFYDDRQNNQGKLSYNLSFHLIDVKMFKEFLKHLEALNKKSNILPGWFGDCLSYYEKCTEEVSDQKKKDKYYEFFSNLENSTEKFAKGIMGEYYGKYKCDFMVPEGSGKRKYEFAVQGLGGDNQKNKGETIKNKFHLLPYLVFKGNKKDLEATINLHFSWQADYGKSTNWCNYLPYKQLESYKKEASRMFKGTRPIIDEFFDSVIKNPHAYGIALTGRLKKKADQGDNRLQIVHYDPVKISLTGEGFSDLRKRMIELLSLCEILKGVMLESSKPEEMKTKLKEKGLIKNSLT